MALPVVRVDQGPRLVLVHGSATDHTTWAIQLASSLRQRFQLVAYDRHPVATIEAAAAELAAVIGDAPDAPLVVGSSFGAVVALELARSQPATCAGLVLIEPPLATTDEPDPAVPRQAALLARFDRAVAEAGGPAAGELFLRTVLGEPAFARIPPAFLERSKAKWAEIRADCVALTAYASRYTALRALDVPVLLLGGERSAPAFRATLDALAAVLPRARRETLARAGHMLHAEVPARFAELLRDFADSIGLH